ncbi:MAG TPA: alpha/beta hydrolase-fold protein [Blastocatellia bacterium]|nr:alpha/beta hydrolase-fold protein [Blastocatellia bacterium]
MSTRRQAMMLALAGALALTWPSRVRQDDEMFQARVTKVGASEYHFRVFTPNGWSRKKKWPVILFLHGAGERGDDNLAQIRVGIGSAITRQQTSFPFVVVLPQCPKGRWWTEPEMQSLALKALDEAAKEFKGDSKRTYLTGLSMGGYGSWVIAASNPKRFAALAVVCGGVRPPPRLNLPDSARPPEPSADPYGAIAAKIGKTPVWVFHGSADPAVPVTESRKMVEALKAIGGNVRYNEYEGVGHNSWDKAYAEPELFPWLLSLRRK